MKRHKKFIYSRDAERLAAIKVYIAGNLEKDLRISTLAALFSMSKSALQRHFFAYEKVAIHAYIYSSRMKKAKELLSDNKLAIQQISIAVGYSSNAAFTHQFTTFFGYGPLTLRPGNAASGPSAASLPDN